MKYSSYSYWTTVWCCWFRLSITKHKHESQKKNGSRTNTKILTRRLCVYSACSSGVSFFCCCCSLDSFISILSDVMNLNVLNMHISNGMSLMSMLYTYSLQPVLINQRCWEYEWIRVYASISILFHDCLWVAKKNDSLLISGSNEVNVKNWQRI